MQVCEKNQQTALHFPLKRMLKSMRWSVQNKKKEEKSVFLVSPLTKSPTGSARKKQSCVVRTTAENPQWFCLMDDFKRYPSILAWTRAAFGQSTAETWNILTKERQQFTMQWHAVSSGKPWQEFHPKKTKQNSSFQTLLHLSCFYSYVDASHCLLYWRPL